MCLDCITFKVFKFLSLLVIMVPGFHTQLYQSPCPETFQYEMDQNGQLYGTIGVYSFDKNVITLDVELSVGNHVGNYNGHIELAIPRDEVLNAIQRNAPIKYRVYFPRWNNVPPKVTKVEVNGQRVCSGPSLPLNGWFRIVTSITLRHRFTIKQNPLVFNPFIPDNSLAGNSNNPFIGQGVSNKNYDNSGATKRYQNPFFSTSNGYNNGAKIYEIDVVDVLLNTTTPKTTTEKRTPNSGVTELLFAENPFLSGKITPSVAPKKSLDRNSYSRNRPIPKVSTNVNTCGVPLIANPLVVNGKSVPLGAFPWLTAMFASTEIGVLEYKCCGSLVSSKHVITAAHCVQKGKKIISAEKLLFALGKLNIANLRISDGEKMIGAEDVKVHPDYKPFSSDADIAVVTLDQFIEFTTTIRPICIWSESEDIDDIVGERGKVVGWGRDENNNSMTAEPRQITMPIVSQEECLRSAEVFKGVTSSRSFCAGERNENGPCNGDSGSGFIIQKNSKWFLKGIVSISAYDDVKQSCDLSKYVVFTDVSKFRIWLSSIILI